MIVAAAVKIGDMVWTGERHAPITRESDSYVSQSQQGFITDGGAFLSRAEAEAHARECGQKALRRAVADFAAEERP